MLDRSHRLRSGTDFSRVSRHGRRRQSRHLIVHRLRSDAQSVTRLGFVTSKAVGNAVVRNQVKRRLREIARELLTEVPTGFEVIVRARANAATASFAELRDEVREGVLHEASGRRRSE